MGESSWGFACGIWAQLWSGVRIQARWNRDKGWNIPEGGNIPVLAWLQLQVLEDAQTLPAGWETQDGKAALGCGSQHPFGCC